MSFGTGSWFNNDMLFDPEGFYGNVLSLYPGAAGTWTPYMFAQSNDTIFGVAHRESPAGDFSKRNNMFSDLASVDIVFTKDRSKWTRSAVIELSSSFNEAEGKAKIHELRKGRSVNQNGDTAVVSNDPALNSDLISPYGMGWFPGYAINVETGERLNIVFGEDSRLISENGRDMKFNPTARVVNSKGRIVMGGRHYIYIMGHTENKKSYVAAEIKAIENTYYYDNPAYDGCAQFVKKLNDNSFNKNNKTFMRGLQFSNCMWVSVPLGDPNNEWLNNDAKVQLRVVKPYSRYFSSAKNGAVNANNYWPMYTFDTKGFVTKTDDVAKAKSDLDLINVVPNPYYAYSKYETNQLDNRIKIINLPKRCEITIYATNGNLIRQFNKDESSTSIDWDLKNFAGISIAGGVYIIHVKSDQGEKIIKWFGSLRPVDLNAF